jgi:hypothetical protein
MLSSGGNRHDRPSNEAMVVNHSGQRRIDRFETDDRVSRQEPVESLGGTKDSIPFRHVYLSEIWNFQNMLFVLSNIEGMVRRQK